MATEIASLIASGRLNDPDGLIAPSVKAGAAAAQNGDLEAYFGALLQLLLAHGTPSELRGEIMVAASIEFAAIIQSYIGLRGTSDASTAPLRPTD